MSRNTALHSQTNTLAATLAQTSNSRLILVPMPSVLRQLDEILFGAPTVAAFTPFPPELTDQGDLLLWERADEVTGCRQEFKKRRISAAHLETAVSHLFAKRGDLALSSSCLGYCHPKEQIRCPADRSPDGLYRSCGIPGFQSFSAGAGSLV